MNAKLLWTLTVITVLAVGNIYYSQPLLQEIANTYQTTAARAGMIPTLSQLGYVLGLFFVVPLGDVLEQRSLLTTLLSLAAVTLIGCAFAPSFGFFAISAFGVGITAVLVQIIIPLVAALSPREDRGRNLGLLLSGALLGVLLSRTLSGIVGAHFGWRSVYLSASFIMIASAGALRILLPRQQASTRLTYGRLLYSVFDLFRRLPAVRAIAFNGALMYAALSTFLASLAFYLHSSTYNLGPQTAGLFGLIGAVGALAANIAGRRADRVGARRTIHFCIGLMIASFILMATFGWFLPGLILGVILLDLGAQAATVANQTQLYGLHAEAQTRLNTIYKMTYFIGGAMGSALSAVSWQHFGWTGVCVNGIFFLVVAAIWERFSPLNQTARTE